MLSTSEDSGSEASGAYTEVDLSSSVIRRFTGPGDSQSRAQVQKETAAIATANAQAQARRIQETNSGKLVAAIEALSAAVVSWQALNQEAAARARMADARESNKRRIEDLRGQLEFAEPGKEEMELRAAIRIAHQMPDSQFLVYTSAATTSAKIAAPTTSVSKSSAAATRASAAGVAAPATSVSTSSAAVRPAFSGLPGFQATRGSVARGVGG